MVDDYPTRGEDRSSHWRSQATDNVMYWGWQSPETLLLATMEELGELVQAVLEARDEDAPTDRIQDELDDLAALMYQLQWQFDLTHGDDADADEDVDRDPPDGKGFP